MVKLRWIVRARPDFCFVQRSGSGLIDTSAFSLRIAKLGFFYLNAAVGLKLPDRLSRDQIL